MSAYLVMVSTDPEGKDALCIPILDVDNAEQALDEALLALGVKPGEAVDEDWFVGVCLTDLRFLPTIDETNGGGDQDE